MSDRMITARIYNRHTHRLIASIEMIGWTRAEMEECADRFIAENIEPGVECDVELSVE